MNKTMLLFTILFAIIGTIVGAINIDQNLLNKNVERTIDATSQLVKVQHKVTLENKSKKDISAYTFVVPTDVQPNLSFISIRDALKKDLKPVEEKIAQGVAYTVTLPTPSANPVLYIETVFTKCLHAYPTHITQSERQLVRYFGSAHFYSPYKTVQQKTSIQLSSKNVESFTAVKPSSHSDTVISYGPYDNVKGRRLRSACLEENVPSNPLLFHSRILNRAGRRALRKPFTIFDCFQFGASHRSVALGQHCCGRDNWHYSFRRNFEGFFLSLRFPKGWTKWSIGCEILQNHLASFSQWSLLQVRGDGSTWIIVRKND